MKREQKEWFQEYSEGIESCHLINDIDDARHQAIAAALCSIALSLDKIAHRDDPERDDGK